MKALVLEKYNKLVYRDFPTPKPADDEVLIQVKAAGICGSDVHGMDGSSGRRIPPLVMGHEASGVIHTMGKAVKGWSIGERVTFDSTIYRLDDWYTRRGFYNLSDNRMVLGVSPGPWKKHGAFAELVGVPQHILHRIPDGVSFTQAAMVEPVAVGTHAVNLTPLEKEDAIAVVGGGMIGLFLLQVLKARDLGPVIVLDLESTKLELATELGADYVFQPGKENVKERVLEITGGRGADAVFEAVGNNETVNSALDLVRKGGTVTLVGNLSPRVEIPLQKVVTEQIRLQGSCAICGEYPEVLDMMARGVIRTDPLLSAEAPLSEGAGWFRRLYAREPGLIKVVLKP